MEENGIVVNRYEVSRYSEPNVAKRIYKRVVPSKIRGKFFSYRNFHTMGRLIKQYSDDGVVDDYPKGIEIETYNMCNGTCSFCPVNINTDTRKHVLMDENLFRKLIDELSNVNYQGRLSLYSNNEPFLDKRIVKFSEYAKNRVPHAYQCIYTNGTILNLDTFKEIIPFLDLLLIDNYNDNLVLNPRTQEIYDYVMRDLRHHPELKNKVRIHIRKKTEVLSTRGGDAPNNNERKRKIDAYCLLPFQQMSIRPDGKISLCCSDPLGKMTMGDLNEMTIKEAWNGKTYTSFRKAMKKNKRNCADICRYCDTDFIFT